jgi:hypothetical protein
MKSLRQDKKHGFNSRIRKVDGCSSMFIGLADQNTLVSDATEHNITHVVVVPWTRVTPDAACMQAFYYHFAPGYLGTAYSDPQIAAYARECCRYIKKALKSTNNNVLICDDNGGRGGASVVLLTYLCYVRHMGYKQAWDTVVSIIGTPRISRKLGRCIQNKQYIPYFRNTEKSVEPAFEELGSTGNHDEFADDGVDYTVTENV